MATKQTFDEKIVALRKENKTWAEIQEIMKCSQQVVYRVLFKAGLTNQGGPRKVVTEEVRDQIISLREAKKTYMEISVTVGVSVPVVNRVLREAGLVRQPAAK